MTLAIPMKDIHFSPASRSSSASCGVRDVHCQSCCNANGALRVTRAPVAKVCRTEVLESGLFCCISSRTFRILAGLDPAEGETGGPRLAMSCLTALDRLTVDFLLAISVIFLAVLDAVVPKATHVS